MHESVEIAEGRDLTQDERELVLWLLEHGTDSAKLLLNQLSIARVCSRCGCGCASIDFVIDEIVPDCSLPMKIVSDYEWRDEHGNMLGAFVFSRNGRLSGLDLWSIDGNTLPTYLPDVARLVPIGTTT